MKQVSLRCGRAAASAVVFYEYDHLFRLRRLCIPQRIRSVYIFNHLPSPSSFFSSQYRNRLLTIIIRGITFHFSSIILDKQSNTPCISLLPFTSIHTTLGAELTRDVSHRVRMAVISFDINTSPRANLHFGYLLE